MKVDEAIQMEFPQGNAPKDPPPRVHHILVVDDEPTVLEVTRRILKDAGYQTEGAVDGAAAWDILQTKSFDLIITDNNMPRVSGLELIGLVHKAGMAMPVIMATAAVPQDQFNRSPWLKPAATLVKPYSSVEFLVTVKNVLSGGSQSISLP